MVIYRPVPVNCGGNTRPIVKVDFSQVTPDGYFLISASKDGLPMFRQGETGDWIGTFLGHKGAIWDATLDTHAIRAATAGADFTAKLWSAIDGEELHSYTHKHIVKCVDFSKNNHTSAQLPTKLLTGSNEKLVRLFDLGNYDSEPVIYDGFNSYLKDIAFLENDKLFLCLSDDNILRQIDTNSKQEIFKSKFRDTVSSMELSYDQETLTISHGKTITFLNSKDLSVKKEFESQHKIASASFSPFNDIFVYGGEDYKIYKCDYNTNIEFESYKAHFGPIHCLKFSPDGQLYASGSEDGTIRLWQTVPGSTYGLWESIPVENSDTTSSELDGSNISEKMNLTNDTLTKPL